MLGVLLWLFRRGGWTVVGRAPPMRKAVLIGAPHTSNWDFVVFLGVTHAFGIGPRFMGKSSLFRWPLTRFMRDMGGAPVDRSASRNAVEQTIEAFAAHDDFHLVIAPEGTRGGANAWKTGFYHIALGAGVPIVPGHIDYDKRVAGLGDPIIPTGDYAADMARIAAFYAGHGVTVRPLG